MNNGNKLNPIHIVIMCFIAAAVLMAFAAIRLLAHSSTNGIIFLCLGAALMCAGSVLLNMLSKK